MPLLTPHNLCKRNFCKCAECRDKSGLICATPDLWIHLTTLLIIPRGNHWNCCYEPISRTKKQSCQTPSQVGVENTQFIKNNEPLRAYSLANDFDTCRIVEQFHIVPCSVYSDVFVIHEVVKFQSSRPNPYMERKLHLTPSFSSNCLRMLSKVDLSVVIQQSMHGSEKEDRACLDNAYFKISKFQKKKIFQNCVPITRRSFS